MTAREPILSDLPSPPRKLLGVTLACATLFAASLSSGCASVRSRPSGSIVCTPTTLGGSGESGINAIAADVRGGFALAGWFRGGTLGDGAGGNALQPSALRQGFVLRFDAQGELKWARAFGGGEADAIFALHFTADGDLVAAGLSRSAGFAVRMAGEDGEPHWQLQLPGNDSHLRALAFDRNSDVWAIGAYAGTLAFPFGQFVSQGEHDLLVIQFSGTSGAIRTAFTFGGLGNEQGRAIAVRADGSLVIAGEFGAGLNPGAGAIDFGVGPIATHGDTDAFLAALNPSGDPLWVRTFGGTGNDELQSLVLAADGDTLAVGHTQPSINYKGRNPHEAATFRALAVRVGADGTVRWQRESSGGQMVLQDLLLDAEGTIWTSGLASNAVSFDREQLTPRKATEALLGRLGADGRAMEFQSCSAFDASYGYSIARVGDDLLIAGLASIFGRSSGFYWRTPATSPAAR